MKTKLRHVASSPKPSITDDWHLAAFDKMVALIPAAVNEAIHYAMEDGEATYIRFPSEWFPSDGGQARKAPDDPLTIYLELAVDGDDENPTYAFSIRDALKNTIEQCAEDGSFDVGLARISKSFRELANEIDVAIAKTSAK